MNFLIKRCLLVSFILSAHLAVGQKWEKYISKYNDYYNKGDYEKALSTNEKFKKKAIQKLGAKNKYIPFVNMNDAKLNLQNGELINVETNLNEAISVSEEVNKMGSEEHAEILLEALNLYVELGNYRLAHNTLNNFLSNYPDKNQGGTKAELILFEIKILLEKGFYNESIDRAREEFTFFMQRVNDNSIKKDEREKRYSQFARLINLTGEAFIKKGDYQSADSALKSNTGWIEKNLDKKDAEYAIHELEIARSLDSQRKYSEAEKYFEDASNHAKSGKEPYDRFALAIQRELIVAYARYGKKGRHQSEMAEYETRIYDHYPKTSVFTTYQTLLKLQSEPSSADISSYANQLIGIVTDNENLPANHETKLIANHYLYRIYTKKKDLVKSKEALEREKEIKKNLFGEESPEYHLTLIEEGIYDLKYTNNIKRVDSIFSTSWQKVVLPEINYSHPSFIHIQNNLATYYEMTDQYDLASKALDDAFNATTHTFDRNEVDYANEIVRLADLQTNIGEYDRAEKYLDLSLETLYDHRKDAMKNMLFYISALEAKARIFTIKGMYDEAEDLFITTRKLVKKSDLEDYDMTVRKEEIAKIYLNEGLYSEASEIIEQIIGGFQNSLGANNKALIEPLIVKGRLKLLAGDYTEAQKIAQKSFEIAESVYGTQTSNKIAGLILQADINSTLGDYENAEKNLSEALNTHLKIFGEKQLQLADIYSKLALVKLNKDQNVAESKKLFKKSEEILLNELDKENPLYAELLKNLAYTYIANAEYGEAFNALLSAQNILTKKTGKRNNINAAGIYVLLGDLYYMLKNFSEAETNYNKAKQLYNKYFSSHHPEYVKSIAKLSKVMFMKGNEKQSMKLMEEALSNYDEFIKYYFPALSEREKARFWNTIKDDYEFYNTLVIRNIESPDDKLVGKLYDNALNTKALLLNSSIKMRENILKSGDETLIENYNKWLTSKELLTNVLSMSTEELIRYQINEDSLVRVVEMLEKDLSERSELFSNNKEKTLVSWEDVKKTLKENEMAIEIIRFRYFDHVLTDSIVYAVLTLKNDRNSDRPNLIILKDGKDLENKYFKYYKNMIVFRQPDKISYQKFWEPIDKRISDNATIYLSPDGVFNQINLESLLIDSSRYVLDNSNIILVSNTKDLVLHQIKKAVSNKEKRALMFGDPDFYVSTKPSLGNGKMIINPLPGTEKEVKSLNDLLKENGWKTDYYLQINASEDQVKALQNPRVFHIATHGFYTPKKDLEENINMDEINEAQAVENPLLRSGLMLKGAGDVLDKTRFNYNIESGILTAYEAMNLNLDYTDLVVLSACETGVGDVTAGEGVYGLQRAFLVAGAKTLIMSLFKVSDEATNELMVSFYEKWLSTGEMRSSFIQAKKELRNKYKDPIYWGSFIMFGLD